MDASALCLNSGRLAQERQAAMRMKSEVVAARNVVRKSGKGATQLGDVEQYGTCTPKQIASDATKTTHM